MLSESELTAMRETAGSALPGTAVVYSQQWVSDGGGGGTTTWTPSGTVSCRIAPLNGAGESEVVTGARITPEADAIVTLPYGTSITTEARLLIDGGTYNVEAIRLRHYATTVRVEVTKEV